MSNKLLVMLADDSRFFRSIERQFLGKYPVDIVEAENCEMALTLAFEQKPGLIYMAFSLPGEGGGAVCCSALKSNPLTRDIPIVIICDQGEPQQPDRSRQCGCDACLVKPLDKYRFLQIGRRYLEGLREHRQSSFFDVVMTTGGAEYFGKCLDISGGGMFIESRDDLAVGTLVNMNFRLPGPSTTLINCQAKVAWVNGKPIPKKPHYPIGFGLKFVALSPASHTAILQLSEKMSKD